MAEEITVQIPVAPAQRAKWEPKPAHLAAGFVIVGTVSAVAGVYVLWGVGWALIAASVPLLGFGAILVKGIVRGG